MVIRVVVISCLIAGMGLLGIGCKPSSSRSSNAPALSGEAVFANHCMGCHAGGQNSLVPNKPIQGSAKLASGAAFSQFVREGAGSMPGFSSDVLSKQDLDALYEYVSKTFQAPESGSEKQP